MFNSHGLSKIITEVLYFIVCTAQLLIVMLKLEKFAQKKSILKTALFYLKILKCEN